MKTPIVITGCRECKCLDGLNIRGGKCQCGCHANPLPARHISAMRAEIAARPDYGCERLGDIAARVMADIRLGR